MRKLQQRHLSIFPAVLGVKYCVYTVSTCAEKALCETRSGLLIILNGTSLSELLRIDKSAGTGSTEISV